MVEFYISARSSETSENGEIIDFNISARSSGMVEILRDVRTCRKSEDSGDVCELFTIPIFPIFMEEN